LRVLLIILHVEFHLPVLPHFLSGHPIKKKVNALEVERMSGGIGSSVKISAVSGTVPEVIEADAEISVATAEFGGTFALNPNEQIL
jgi:hypothetical protein